MRMKKVSQLTLGIIMGVAAVQASSAVDYGSIADQIELVRQKTGAAGFTVAIVKDNSPVLLKGFGFSDRDAQIPVTAETSFRIGSITKTFTALAVMKLVEAGKISLDDSIYDYLPEYQPKTFGNVNPEIRIRDLLSHHSGISSGWHRGIEIVADPLQTFHDYPLTLSRDYLTWDRRTVYAYNNMAYTLAGLVVERVSGLSWPAFLQQNFFTPLGMENAFSHLPENPFEAGISRGYMGGNPIPLRSIPVLPAGTIIASANDMARYMQALLDSWHYDSRAVLTEELLKEMAQQQNGDVALDKFKMGLGFFIHTVKGAKVIEHGGNTFAFHSHLIMVPEQKLGIFISTNEMEAMKSVPPLAFSLLDQLIEDDEPASFSRAYRDEPTGRVGTLRSSFSEGELSAADILNEKPLIFSEEPEMARMMRAAPLSSAVSAEIEEGYYYGVGQGLLKVVKDPVLGLSVLFKGGSFPLYPSGDQFEIGGMPGMSLEISSEHKGVHLFQYGRELELFYPVSETAPTEDYEKFVGDYTIDGGSMFFAPLKIVYDHSTSLLSMQFANQDAPLKIVGDNLVQVQGRGRGAGMVLELNGENKLYGMGYDFTKVH